MSAQYDQREVRHIGQLDRSGSFSRAKGGYLIVVSGELLVGITISKFHYMSMRIWHEEMTVGVD
jgi:hypothetical protein